MISITINSIKQTKPVDYTKLSTYLLGLCLILLHINPMYKYASAGRFSVIILRMNSINDSLINFHLGEVSAYMKFIRT